MSEPQRPRSIPEYTDSISIVIVNWITQANVYMDHLEAERDKLLKAINDLDAVWLRTDTHSRVRDTDLGWHIANVRGIAQEAKHE